MCALSAPPAQATLEHSSPRCPAGTKARVDKSEVLGHTLRRIKCRSTSDVSAKGRSLLYEKDGQLVDRATWQEARLAGRKAEYATWGALHKDARSLHSACEPDGVAKVVVWSRQQPAPAVSASRETKPTSTMGKAALALAHAQLAALCQGAAGKACVAWPSAPAMQMLVPCANLMALAKDPLSALVFRDSSGTSKPTVSDQWQNTTRSQNIVGGTTIDGSGTSVCVMEPNQQNDYSFTVPVERLVPTGPLGSHAVQVSAFIRSSAGAPLNGIAPATSVYLANWAGSATGNVSSSTAFCASRNVNNWVYSRTANAMDEALFDHSVKSAPYPLMVVSSGNTQAQMNTTTVTGSGTYNLLSVGATNDVDTMQRGDDTCVSQYIFGNGSVGSAGDYELPHLVAPGWDLAYNNQTSTGINGTSFAAPQVAAAGALLDQVAPGIQGWPEAKRAILLTSANENVCGDINPLADATTDDRDGVGELNILLAETIAVPANKTDGGAAGQRYGYDYGTLDAGTDFNQGTGDYAEVYNISVPANGGGGTLRVVLAWDGTACPGNSPYGTACQSSVLDADLDIRVCKVGTSLCFSSQTYENSYEMVQIPVSGGDAWTVTIEAWGFQQPSTWYGIAWAVDSFGTL